MRRYLTNAIFPFYIIHISTVVVGGYYLAISRLKAGITVVILCRMKTAISIPDSLFEEADRLAKRRGWSRSELYANAVTAYVNSERFSGVREKLDAVYGNDEEDSAVDPLLADAQARSLPRDKW